jgi:hypothetical protein
MWFGASGRLASRVRVMRREQRSGLELCDPVNSVMKAMTSGTCSTVIGNNKIEFAIRKWIWNIAQVMYNILPSAGCCPTRSSLLLTCAASDVEDLHRTVAHRRRKHDRRECAPWRLNGTLATARVSAFQTDRNATKAWQRPSDMDATVAIYLETRLMSVAVPRLACATPYARRYRPLALHRDGAMPLANKYRSSIRRRLELHELRLHL